MTITRTACVLAFALAISTVSDLRSAEAQPDPGRGLLEMNLATALGTDFFGFFRLEETMREKDAGKNTVVVFKPSGKFRKLVTVRVTLGAQERIVRMELDVARSFIDTPSQRPFANDIVKSLLIGTPPRGDLADLKGLLDEITYRRVPGLSTVPLGSTRPVALPAKESAGYLTYTGARDSYSQQLPRSVLNMDNGTDSGEAWFRIRLGPRSP